LVDEFDVEKDFSSKGVVGVPNLFEVDKGVDGSEESSVEPTPTLGNELGNGI
jgi:hypothetical protein